MKIKRGMYEKDHPTIKLLDRCIIGLIGLCIALTVIFSKGII